MNSSNEEAVMRQLLKAKPADDQAAPSKLQSRALNVRYFFASAPTVSGFFSHPRTLFSDGKD